MGRPAKYPEEFRREAVALYRSSDRSRAEVAKSLGISDGSLAAWVKTAERDEAPDALDPTERARRSVRPCDARRGREEIVTHSAWETVLSRTRSTREVPLW